MTPPKDLDYVYLVGTYRPQPIHHLRRNWGNYGEHLYAECGHVIDNLTILRYRHAKKFSKTCGHCYRRPKPTTLETAWRTA